MDLALREIAEYDEVKDLKPEEAQAIFNPQRPHAFMTVRIYNTGVCAVWIKTKDGVLNYAPSRPTIGIATMTKGYVYVEVVHGSKHNSGRQKDVVFRYRLNPKLLCKGCAVYLKTLGIYVSPDRKFLENMVVPEDTLLVDRLRDLVSRSLNQMKQCPISVILSDPTGELAYVYAILDRTIYRIPVLHTREYGKTCVVRFSGVDEVDSDAIYDFTLDEMLEAFREHKEFTPQIGQYKLMLFGSLE
ncbi:MAG: hypothetical protein K2H85_02445, partial [Allobaculum sp.]|nr:hypothetical protein [Allobaculum sp.]